MQTKLTEGKICGVIKLDDLDQSAIAAVKPNFEVRWPVGLRLKVALDEIVTKEDREKLENGTVTAEISRVSG
jgi:hypothetical protein